MRQRNCTGGPLVFPTLDPPLEVESNGVIDPDDDLGLLPGFEAVDPAEQPPTPPAPPADPPADPPAVDAPAQGKPKSTKRASAAAATDDAGEA